jgi:hypothetical protein
MMSVKYMQESYPMSDSELVPLPHPMDGLTETPLTVNDRLEAVRQELADIASESPGELAGIITRLGHTKAMERDPGVLVGRKNRAFQQGLSIELIELICEHILKMKPLDVALRMVGHSQQSHTSWRATAVAVSKKLMADPDCELSEMDELCLTYMDAVHTSLAYCEGSLVERIFDAAEGDWQAAKWALSRRFPKGWGASRERLDVRVGGEVQVKHTGVMVVGNISASADDWARQNAQAGNVIDVESIPSISEVSPGV